MSKIWTWLKIALGIVFTVGVYVFLTKGNNTELKKRIDEVKKKAKIEEEKVKKIKKKIEGRKKEAKDLSDRLDKHFKIFIIVCLMFSFSVVGTASSNIDDLIIPDNYEDLVEAYKDMANIAINYQRLYQEAEADNEALMEVIKNLQDLMEVQQDIIDDLLQKNRFSILTSINYVPLHPDYSAIMLGLSWAF